MYKANSFVQEYFERHKHTWFTVQQVNHNLISLLPQNEIPRCEYIRNYMRDRLKMKYKRISWRSRKNLNRELVVKRLRCTNLIDIVRQESYILVQIDEFWVGRNILPSMAWVQKGWSGIP